jgi:predicted SprT family Zn-dependent metalloprotease
VIAEISSESFDMFFGWAPLVIGLIIYAIFFVAKRHEVSTPPASRAQASYACAVCGRRGSLEQMIARDHAGAVGYLCSHCATASATAH